MIFKSLDDVTESVVNNIYATASDIKEAIEFLSIVKGTKEYSKIDIISLIKTLEWRLEVIDKEKSIKSKQTDNNADNI